MWSFGRTRIGVRSLETSNNGLLVVGCWLQGAGFARRSLGEVELLALPDEALAKSGCLLFALSD